MDLSKTILRMFGSSAAKRPCNMCDCVFKDNMLVNGNPRDPIIIRQVSTFYCTQKLVSYFVLLQKIAASMSESECKEISFHPEYNSLFELPGFNPCMNPSCRMHSCDQGIFKKIFDIVVQQIKMEPIHIIREFENRSLRLIFTWYFCTHSFADGGDCFDSLAIAYSILVSLIWEWFGLTSTAAWLLGSRSCWMDFWEMTTSYWLRLSIATGERFSSAQLFAEAAPAQETLLWASVV